MSETIKESNERTSSKETVSKKSINKEKFMLDIFYGDFDGKGKICAKSLGISGPCLKAFIDENEVKSHKLPAAVYKYCVATGKKPELFLS